ncbi:MAG TPA: ATP-binding cassette domain-containing protein, partial [Oscillospiraceae bacterium]|nr:ATP-binding cassette domain-containing protein [Oscillospiraceae bacterium]
KMLDTFQLPHKQKIKSMSKGMQEKLQLLLVVCRNAKLYILDEPIGGVDPAARDFILSAIMGNLPKDSTVLISTHLIHDVEGIFDTALMIGNGRVLKNEKVVDGKIGDRTIEDVFKEVFGYAWQIN